MWLAQAKATDFCAAGKRLQIALLLRFAAERPYRPAYDGVLNAQDGRRCAVACRDLLQSDRERDVVQTRAAVILGDDDAACAEPPELGQRFARKNMLAIPSSRIGRESLLRECAHGVANELLLLAQQHRFSPR